MTRFCSSSSRGIPSLTGLFKLFCPFWKCCKRIESKNNLLKTEKKFCRLKYSPLICQTRNNKIKDKQNEKEFLHNQIKN